MLQIIIAVSAASPLVLRNRIVGAFRFWIATILLLAVGMTVATLVYFAILFAVVETYALNRPLGGLIYGAGFILATWLAIIAAAQLSATRLAKIVIPGIRALAVLFPAGINIYLYSTGTWRPIYLLYLLGSLAAANGASRLSFPARRVARLRAA